MRPVDLLEPVGLRQTPLILQTEAAECGLACLAMVACFHGFRIDLAALRARAGVSLKGATLKSLIQIAGQLGLVARPLRGEIEDFAQIPLPTIVHWDLNHFVVLTRISRSPRGRKYRIHDPARGALTLHEGEFSRHFTGVALELSRAANFQPRTERSRLTIGQLWSKVAGLGSALRNVLLLSIILQLVALATPFYLQIAVDTAFPSFDGDLLLMLAIGFGGLMLINMLTGWLRALILVSLGGALSYQIVANLNRHLLRLPLPWFEKRHVGDIISRVGSTQPISQLLSQGLVAALIDGLMAFVTLGLMFAYSPLLAGVALLAWFLFALVKAGFLHALRLRSIDSITKSAKENSAFIESVRGIQAIKAFGQERNRHLRWQQLKADAVNAQIRLGRLSSAFDAGGQLILALERVLFVYLAIRLAMGGAFTVGMIFAFQAYKQQFLDAATRLVEQSVQYRLLDVHLGRIADIALAPLEGGKSPGLDSAPRVSGAIETRHLGFRYGVGEPEVLRGVNVSIEAGEMVALIGPSGGGKTTLLRLLMGLFEPTYGQVLIDGLPLANLGPEAWRRQIGSVSQNDSLFAGTLAENIAFFDPEIDMERVTEVARIARIHDDIEALPMRYDTMVGDMGSALSGGQKQRVLLARALYPDPAVLFIDEGTAHLDPAAEAAIMANIRALPITRTVRAHRPVPVETATKVYLVRGGMVVPVHGLPGAHAPNDASIASDPRLAGQAAGDNRARAEAAIFGAAASRAGEKRGTPPPPTI